MFGQYPVPESSYAVKVELTPSHLLVYTRDGRIIQAPLAWFPWLETASLEQRQDVTVWGFELFWNALDDGISMQTLLFGRP